MIVVNITGVVVGRARLYEQPGRKGKAKLVPTYRAVAECLLSSDAFEFAVTRCSSEIVFKGQADRFGTNGECPPSIPGKPYRARVAPTERLGFSLLLYEPEYANDQWLRGTGPTARVGIRVHFGPAASLGCLTVGGGKKGFDRFQRRLKQMIRTNGTGQIRVAIHNRSHV